MFWRLNRHLSCAAAGLRGVSVTGAPNQELVFTKALRLDVQGRDVLLIDDILDTATLAQVTARLLSRAG
jgi:hypoxanthine-guanine phosphoribosyltransferase